MIKKLESSKFYRILKERESEFLTQIGNTLKYTDDILPKINRIFSSYTQHGICHSLNVLDYMYDLCSVPEELSDIEITVIIYSALLHDIGMAVSDDEIEAIKNDQSTMSDKKFSLILEKYGHETVALQEYIRPIHGKYSQKHINEIMDSSLFLIPRTTQISFREDVANICAAHNEDFDWLTENLQSDQKKGNDGLNSQFIAMLLRIADYLDLDEKRAPLYLYHFVSPKDNSDLEWRQHFDIENFDKITTDEITKRKSIEFYGESSNPAIHRKLLKYFDNISNEVGRATTYAETNFEPRYHLELNPKVRNKIRARGFHFSDFKLSLDYNAVTNLLMGENIYGDRKYGLRELIQNSIDACKIMQEEAQGKEEFKYEPYSPFINIDLDHDRKKVIIFDNGKGMSIDILKNYFLNVGVSYYISDDFKFKGMEYVPIGNYGIGFLACFMLSSNVQVITKFYGEIKTNKIEFERSSEYICLTFEETQRTHGTEIILDYDQFFEVFRNQDDVKSFIEQNFIDCQIPIKLKSSKDGINIDTTIELRTLESLYTEPIRLDPYFKNIEIAIKFNYKGLKFLSKFSEINTSEGLIFQDDKIIREEDFESSILLKHYIVDNKITFLNIPIIDTSEEDNFLKAYEVLDYFDDALGKGNYKSVNVIAIDSTDYHADDLIERDEDRIIGEYTFSDFVRQFSHSSISPTYTYLVKKECIQAAGDKIIFYEKEKPFYDKYSWVKTDCIYINNVLISKAQIKVPFLIEGIELKGLIVNVKNKSIIPNVSRNGISDQQIEILSNAIGKALHLWIVEHAGLQDEEKNLVKKFIQKCYPHENVLLQSEYS